MNNKKQQTTISKRNTSKPVGQKAVKSPNKPAMYKGTNRSATPTRHTENKHFPVLF